MPGRGGIHSVSLTSFSVFSKTATIDFSGGGAKAVDF